MILKYLKLRLNIFKRQLQDDISIAGIVLITVFASLLYIYLAMVLHSFPYGKYIALAIFTSNAIMNCANRKDSLFLKTQGIKLSNILIVENILISTLFWIIDYRLIPVYIGISVCTALLVKNKTISLSRSKFRIPAFVNGSFEWISGLRQHILIVVIVDILFMIIAIVYNNYAFAQISIISLNIASAYIFHKAEPINYIKQYPSPKALLKAKTFHVFTNTLIINSSLIILHSIFFPEKTVLLIIYLLFSNILINGFMYAKYCFIENNIFREIIQMLILCLFILSCIAPQSIFLLTLLVLLAYVKASKSLKEYYND
jgi:hypothetical protein